MVTNLVDDHDDDRLCMIYLDSDVAKLPNVVRFERSVRSRIYCEDVGYEKLNSGVKTFAGLGCATLASASALPCSASRDCEWQICLVTCRREE